MTFTSTSVAVGMLIVAACFAAAPTPRDPSAVFGAIEGSIAAQDYYKANVLLGSLMDDLLSVGVPPLTGQAHRRAAELGRENGDLVGLVQQARLTWSQAARDEQPWAQVMVRLFVAFSSAVALDSQLPPTVRYEQARTRYEAAPSIILLHQLTLRAFEAGEYAGTLKYVKQERAETSDVYPPEAAGLILHRLETMTGILKLDAGDVAGAVQALTDSASALQQYRAGRRLREAPRMLLAKRPLQAGQSAPVLAYLEVCAQFEYPGGEESRTCAGSTAIRFLEALANARARVRTPRGFSIWYREDNSFLRSRTPAEEAAMQTPAAYLKRSYRKCAGLNVRRASAMLAGALPIRSIVSQALSDAE